MTLALPAQRPVLLKADLIVYLDQDGSRFVKAAAVPEMGDEELISVHEEVQQLIASLKARRDSLNKMLRKKQLPDTRPVQKAKRWLRKAGTLNVLLEHEIARRKKQASQALSEAFVQEARRLLKPEQFDQVLLAAIKAAGQ